MQLRPVKLLLALLGVACLAPNCPALDSVSLRILTDTGSRIALEDPLTFNAGTIRQGLAALGHTDMTPRQVRTATDNRAFPATLESMTVANWPLHRGLTSQGMVAKPDDATMVNRLLPGLTQEASEYIIRRTTYYPPIQEPEFVKPVFQHAERPPKQNLVPDVLRHIGRPPSLQVDGYAWARRDKPRLDEPRHERPQYDYSGPPFLFNASPEMLKNPLIANDPSLMRLFVKTNESGIRDSAAAVAAARPVRRLRPASFWDGIEAPNNPRSEYDTATDFETRARSTTRALFDLRDPSNPTAANDPRPSYDSRPSFNPPARRMLRDPNGY